MPQDLFLIAALGILIVFMFTSSRKRKKQAEALLSSVKVGSSVILHSGIVGKITSVEGDRVEIETTPGTKLALLKGAIRSVENSSITEEKPVAKPAAKSASTPAAKVVPKEASKPSSAKPAAKKPVSKSTSTKPAAK